MMRRDYVRNARWVILPGLIFCGAFLRLSQLSTLPPGIFRDEAEKAYNAYCLLKTGHDFDGHFLPIFITVMGVTTSAIYQYFAIPFVALFGLNEWSARLPAAFVGIATLFVNYQWMRIERGRVIALWATAFLAFSPWHIMFSRWAQQGIFLPLLLSAAMLCFTLFNCRDKRVLPLSAIFFATAIYTYDVARLFVPLLMLILAVIYRSRLLNHWRQALLSLFVFLAFLSPTLYLLAFHGLNAQARFQRISIFAPGSSPLQIFEAFCWNYLAHFNPRFLLLYGDAELRHSAGVGVLTIAEFVALIAGIVALFRNRRRADLVLIAWIILFPVAASLTREGIPHALRCIVALPAVQNIAAIGMVWILKSLPRSASGVSQRVAAICLIAGFLPFGRAYFGQYASRSAQNWQFGVKQAINRAESLPSRPAIAFYHIAGAEYLAPFYLRLAPQIAQHREFEKARLYFTPFGMPLNTVIDHFSGGPAVVIMPPYETDAGGEIETYSIGDIPSTEIYMNELALSGSNSIAQ